MSDQSDAAAMLRELAGEFAAFLRGCGLDVPADASCTVDGERHVTGVSVELWPAEQRPAVQLAADLFSHTRLTAEQARPAIEAAVEQARMDAEPPADEHN